MRRIKYFDTQKGKSYVYLSNNFELVFKWIKQHLRIKAFYGTSENAVKTQINVF